MYAFDLSNWIGVCACVSGVCGLVALIVNYNSSVPIAQLAFSEANVDGSNRRVFTDGEQLAYDEGERRQVICTASGSYPAPYLKVLLGNEDISRHFERTVSLQRPENYEGLKQSLYQVQLRNDALEIGYKFADKSFTCLAVVPDAPMEGNETSVTVHTKLTGCTY